MDRSAIAARISGPVLRWLAGAPLERAALPDPRAIDQAYQALHREVLRAGLGAARSPIPPDLAGVLLDGGVPGAPMGSVSSQDGGPGLLSGGDGGGARQGAADGGRRAP